MTKPKKAQRREAHRQAASSDQKFDRRGRPITQTGPRNTGERGNGSQPNAGKK